MKSIQINNTIPDSVRQFSANLKAVKESIKPLPINNTMLDFSKEFAPTLKALESIKALQTNNAIKNIAKQSLISNTTNTSTLIDE